MQDRDRRAKTGSRSRSIALASFLAAIALSAGAPSVWAEIGGYIENETRYRYTDDRGLSKSRNTFQLEYSKNLGSRGIFSYLSLNATLRATYDAAYDLNDDEWGDKAGGPITLEQVGGPTPPPPAGPGFIPPAQVPHGQGLVLPGGDFDDNANPNEGLEVLGQNLHKTSGGLSFGVPVRPCDKDSRGCLDDYMDDDTDDLRFPDFNDRHDWLREFYFNASIPVGEKELGVKLGKQQIIWGRTDLFRVLDVINPVDYSRNNIYDELEDIRIPMWMLETEYRMGPGDIFDDLNISGIWNFDKFRPNKLGQGGTPNQILDAGSFFRGMKNLWDNGGTVSNFAFLNTATDFPAHTIGIRDVELPSWSLSNTQFGGKIEGVYKDLGFSLNYYNFRQQLPVLRGLVPANNPFTPGEDLAPRPFLPAFDIEFPRVQLYGGSLDYYADAIKSVFRVEFAYTMGEEFVNTARPELYSDSDVIRWVVGWDRNTFIRALNEKKAFLISGQVFGQHLLDHQLEQGPIGKIGMPDWEDNYIGTLLVKGWWQNDRLSPQMLVAYDTKARSGALEPSISWLITDHLSVTARWNTKFGHGARNFNDLRAGNQFPPFTATPFHSDPLAAQTIGASGYEPAGRFAAGPFGMAKNEDEVSLNIRYAF